jgi:carbon monoxide dehydrogenase subunit G
MRFQGDLTIEAPRQRAWEFLSDPQQLAQCAPDLRSLRIVDDQRFTVVVRAGVGAVKGNYTFDVTWLERLAPERARVQARGKLPGSAVDLQALMVLSDQGGTATNLHWEADVTFRGLIASVGGRLLQGAADKTTREIYACIKAKLETTPSETVPTTG